MAPNREKIDLAKDPETIAARGRLAARMAARPKTVPKVRPSDPGPDIKTAKGTEINPAVAKHFGAERHGQTHLPPVGTRDPNRRDTHDRPAVVTARDHSIVDIHHGHKDGIYNVGGKWYGKGGKSMGEKDVAEFKKRKGVTESYVGSILFLIVE